MDTLICPVGHSDIENRLYSNVNRGLTCRQCANSLVCEECGAVARRRAARAEWVGVRWVTSMVLADMNLREKGNPLDGGVYAVCLTCHKGMMMAARRYEWHDLVYFGKDGGRVMRLEVPGANRKPYIIGGDQLVALCRPHAEAYRQFYLDRIVDAPGLLTEGSGCTFCFPPYPGRVGGPVLRWENRYFTNWLDLDRHMQFVAEEDRQAEAAIDQFLADNAGRLAGVRVIPEEEALHGKDEA